MKAWTWQDDAACRGRTDDLFFSPDYERCGDKEWREAMAKAVCATCPVLTQCRRYALSHPKLQGTWGGMTETERRSLIRRLRRQRAKQVAA